MYTSLKVNLEGEHCYLKDKKKVQTNQNYIRIQSFWGTLECIFPFRNAPAFLNAEQTSIPNSTATQLLLFEVIC